MADDSLSCFVPLPCCSLNAFAAGGSSLSETSPPYTQHNLRLYCSGPTGDDRIILDPVHPPAEHPISCQMSGSAAPPAAFTPGIDNAVATHLSKRLLTEAAGHVLLVLINDAEHF